MTTPQADLLALAKALEDAIVERETYVHGEGWNVADMGVQKARDALTTALAAQQERIAGLEAERDAAVDMLRVMGEEMMSVGMARGDRTVQLANLRELIRRATPGTPAAGVWVPVEPTPEMVVAGGEAQQQSIGSWGEPKVVWWAMIAAKP